MGGTMVPEPSRDAAPTARPLFILVAEDQDDFRELLARSLEADGARVDRASDGQIALTKVFEANVRPDVIVSDIRMPRTSGLDVLHAVRAAGLTTPVILLTGFGDAVDRAAVESAGGAVLLEKPFDFDDLRTALRNLPSIARLRCR